MSFLEKITEFEFFDFKEYFDSVSSQDVENSLNKNNLDKFDLLSLLSNTATPYIEQMAQQANKLTIQYFGRVISLYAPLYISDLYLIAIVITSFLFLILLDIFSMLECL